MTLNVLYLFVTKNVASRSIGYDDVTVLYGFNFHGDDEKETDDKKKNYRYRTDR